MRHKAVISAEIELGKSSAELRGLDAIVVSIKEVEDFIEGGHVGIAAVKAAKVGILTGAANCTSHECPSDANC
ncbi:hypothetical protein L7F22_002164, partial [Adiantum nelumboides]|nr:hypothetical protein [Adiantum nelumboides]